MNRFSVATARQWADLVGYDVHNELKLVVEVKARIGSRAVNIAAGWLEQISSAQSNIFCMFITPEFIALKLPGSQKKDNAEIIGEVPLHVRSQLITPEGRRADYVVEASASLDLAIDTQRVPLHKLDPRGLERIADSWLESVLWTESVTLEASPVQAWVVESGLHRALRNGRIAPAVGGSATYELAD